MRIALGVEYNGQAFCGWQSQKKVVTVESELKAALEQITNHPVKLYCAGRTDKGVHSKGQVVHFDTSTKRLLRAYVLGTNAYLSKNIVIHWAKEVDETFHARFSAQSRTYCYVIYNHKVRSAIMDGKVTWYAPMLCETLMQKASECLIGEHDFSAFRSSGCTSLSPFRQMKQIKIKRSKEFIHITITANAFLYRMVRNIVGALMLIGAQKKPPVFMQHILAAKTKVLTPFTAQPDGLYLVCVKYPLRYSLPKGNKLLVSDMSKFGI